MSDLMQWGYLAFVAIICVATMAAAHFWEKYSSNKPDAGVMNLRPSTAMFLGAFVALCAVLVDIKSAQETKASDYVILNLSVMVTLIVFGFIVRRWERDDNKT